MNAARAYDAHDGILPFQCIREARKSIFGANDGNVARVLGGGIDSCDDRDVEAGAAQCRCDRLAEIARGLLVIEDQLYVLTLARMRDETVTYTDYCDSGDVLHGCH